MTKTVSVTYSITQTINLDGNDKRLDPANLDKRKILEIFDNTPLRSEDLNGAEPISMAVFDENGKQLADWLF